MELSDNNEVKRFKEKPKGDGSWINIGYFVCEPAIYDYIKEGDQTVFEKNPLQNMAEDGELYAYKHDNFWMPMDTIRDKDKLNNLWNIGKAPWKTW